MFAITGKNPLLDIALKLEEIALSDEYFTSRKLYPNVDFYSGLIYQAMGFPLEMFPVLFAIPRTAGWLAHWRRCSTRTRRSPGPASSTSVPTPGPTSHGRALSLRRPVRRSARGVRLGAERRRA